MIPISGTITNAVKYQVMNSKWQQKKDSGHALSKEERNERENWTEEDYLIADFEEQAAKNREASKNTEIKNKIMSGAALTQEEIEYLEKNNPEDLKKYREIKAERKAYEDKLKKCKTKDEVERVKTETMGEYMSSMKSVVNNPNIPKAAKLAKAQEMLTKTNNIQEVHLKFVQSESYQKLPTEAEEAEKREKERELEDAENRIESGKTEPDQTMKDENETEDTKDTGNIKENDDHNHNMDEVQEDDARRVIQELYRQVKEEADSTGLTGNAQTEKRKGQKVNVRL